MITDEQTLTEGLEVLNASIEIAVANFENSVGFGAVITLKGVHVGKTEDIPKDKIWVASSTARIITNDINVVVSA